MQMVRERLQGWAEAKGEAAGGLPAIEENLFVLAQCIEVAQQARSPLYVAFSRHIESLRLCGPTDPLVHFADLGEGAYWKKHT